MNFVHSSEFLFKVSFMSYENLKEIYITFVHAGTYCPLCMPIILVCKTKIIDIFNEQISNYEKKKSEA